MSKCTCGRTFRPPFCDSTHWLSDEEYDTLAAKVKKIYEKKNVQTTIQPTDQDRLPEQKDVS
jgi:CDGSH-type Zn-finger protein